MYLGSKLVFEIWLCGIHRLGWGPSRDSFSKVLWGLLSASELPPVPIDPWVWVRVRLHRDAALLSSLVHLDCAFLPFGLQSAKPRLDCLIEVYRSCQEILAHGKATSTSPWAPAFRRPGCLPWERTPKPLGWCFLLYSNHHVDTALGTRMDAVDLRATEQVTGTQLTVWCWAKCSWYFSAPLVRYVYVTNWEENLRNGLSKAMLTKSTWRIF